jgi:putative membrane protein
VTRRLALAAGAAALAAAWLGPLPRLAAQSFAAHMVLHMTVVAAAAPLIAVGLAGGRFDPVRRAPALLAAIPASLVELVVVWAWHTPALHHAARQAPLAFAAEQASFLGAGLFLWLAIAGGDSGLRRARAGAAVLALALTFAHMTLLGALLALTPRPLYHHHPAAAAGALADQHAGGVLMLAASGVACIAGGLWAGRGLLRDPEPAMRRA